MKSYTRYTTFAAEYANGGFIAPSKRYLKRSEWQVIAIYQLLKDGNWYTAHQIAELLELKKSTVQNIMQAIANPFGIASGQQGYCIPNRNTILIV